MGQEPQGDWRARAELPQEVLVPKVQHAAGVPRRGLHLPALAKARH